MKIAAALSSLALAAVAQPTSAAFLAPAADTYVNRGAMDTNYGSNTQIQVTNDGGSAFSKTKDAFGVLRFDLSSVDGPIDAATFTATANTSDAFEFQLWGILDGGTDENFDEGTLTFSDFAYTATGNTAADDGSLDETGLTLLVSGVSDGSDGTLDNVYAFSTPALADFLNADTNGVATFILFRTSGDGARTYFASREASSGAPQLSFTVVPEPASVALVAAGAAMIGLRRRAAQ